VERVGKRLVVSSDTLRDGAYLLIMMYSRWGLVLLALNLPFARLTLVRSDPTVGLAVCMEAFNKVPQNMRENLALLLDGKTRFIGGSVDTLYLPSRLRSDFMKVLALFLDTNCFFEIATPTTMHLILPPRERILYVDHVRPHLSLS
jgi:hypothetical protein